MYYDIYIEIAVVSGLQNFPFAFHNFSGSLSMYKAKNNFNLTIKKHFYPQ